MSDNYIHSPIQYHSQNNHGGYNYGYDTGLFGSHQFHQEHKDINGLVKGRYGYTDPNGKLRVVYYKSGPNGFQIISDTESYNSQKLSGVSIFLTQFFINIKFDYLYKIFKIGNT